MSRLILLGPAHEAAGIRRDDVDGSSVSEVLANARTRYGPNFAAVLAVSTVWLNGDTATLTQPVGPSDEIAVVPPVSGG